MEEHLHLDRHQPLHLVRIIHLISQISFHLIVVNIFVVAHNAAKEALLDAATSLAKRQDRLSSRAVFRADQRQLQTFRRRGCRDGKEGWQVI